VIENDSNASKGKLVSDEQPHTIVLIHGLWMSPLSWEHWKARFEGRGSQS
jgi:hypothetical protein